MKFYVYRIFDGHATLYVGKGSGRRLQIQKRRFGCDGEILERFSSERKAYAAECVWIARLRPTENKNTGGGGKLVTRKRTRREKWEIEIEKLGSRVYTARMLLNFDLRGYVDAAGIEKLKQIATSVSC